MINMAMANSFNIDVGTLVIERLSLTNLKRPFSDNYINSTKAILALNVDPVILKRLKAKDISQQRTLEERLAQERGVVSQAHQKTGPYGWYEQHLYLPLMMRYRSALYIHINQGTITSTKSTGRFWLKGIADNEWQDVVVGLHEHRSEKSKESNSNENPWPIEGEFGQVTLRMKIVPGFSPVHTHLRSYNKDMIGADPFYDDSLKIKAQKWIKEQSNSDSESSSKQSDEFDYNLQAAVDEEKSKVYDSEGEEIRPRKRSNVSSEYGDGIDGVMNDTEIEADMMDQTKDHKISKHRAVRKLSMGIDKVKQKVEEMREGFNSETRAGRAVAKEV